MTETKPKPTFKPGQIVTLQTGERFEVKNFDGDVLTVADGRGNVRIIHAREVAEAGGVE